MKRLNLLLIFCLWAINTFAQNSIMDFYEARVKEIQATISDASLTPAIKFKDEKNGFISYDLLTTGIMGFEEMAYFTAKNGKKFVTTVAFGCGPLCSPDLPMFYELENGKLIDKTENYFPISLATQVKAYLLEKRASVLDKIKADYKKKNGVDLPGDIPLGLWVKLPRIGTTIQIGLMEGMMENGNFYEVCELQYNTDQGTFLLVKK